MKKINFRLAALLGIAAFLRIYNLGFGFLETDEAKTALGVDFPHSFVLPSLAHLSQLIFGFNNFAVRLLFALLGVLSVGLFYYLGRELYDKRRGLIFAFVATFLPINVILSRSAYLDIALTASWLSIILCWLKYEKAPSDRNLFYLFLVLAISPWLKIQAVYLFVALFFYILILTKGKFWQDRRFYIMAMSVIPFGFYFLSQPQQVYDMLHYTGDEVGSGSASLWETVRVLWYAYGFYIFAIMGGLILLLKNKDFHDHKKINLFLLIFAALILLIFINTPKRLYYYVMFDIAAVFFGAYFIWEISKKRAQILLLMLVLVFNFLFTFFVINKRSTMAVDLSGVAICDRANAVIAAPAEPKSVYIDPSFGFTYKWCLDYKLKKFDNIKSALYSDENMIVLMDPLNYQNSQEMFMGFLVEDYQGIKILTRLK